MANTFVKTGRPEFDEFFPLVRNFLEKDRLEMTIDGKKIRGFRSPDSRAVWIRDHSDILRGGKYVEDDLTSAVEHFAETQAENGRIFDYFTVFPEKLPCEKENWTKYVRVPVEADVEYRFIKAAYLAWQATGEDGWIQKMLPKMEKALNYVLKHPWRWDKKTGLVKRPYTIDTWDFAYTAGRHEWLEFRITENTFWGVMHGDNSGYYEAFCLMARLFSYFCSRQKADYWREQANGLRRRMNSCCWNGRFYTHFVKLTPVEIPGIDESSQLSLSNPMDINRGAADFNMAVSIIEEYLRRRKESRAFAEWFSIDPPFPDGIFGDEKLKAGAYVNGGIMPLVGGELARAAFEHGFEKYGVDILRRYSDLIRSSGETYLWYFPDGRSSSIDTSTSPEALPTDGWGSSAMLYAFFEGLAGLEDRLKLFERVRLSPRWPAAGIERAEVCFKYAPSKAVFAYDYNLDGNSLELTLRISNPMASVSQSLVDVHLLLPAEKSIKSVEADGAEIPFRLMCVGRSPYLDFDCNLKDISRILIRFV
jgi:hypothetical protein